MLKFIDRNVFVGIGDEKSLISERINVIKPGIVDVNIAETRN